MGGADIGGSKESKAEPNVVPLCDILLVLLIIFMVVTPLIKKGINVQLPEATHTADEPEPGQMITVYVLLKADEDIIYSRVTEVMDKIRQAQIEFVGLVTQESVATE
jgi:biopolymer transport protein TolR